MTTAGGRAGAPSAAEPEGWASEVREFLRRARSGPDTLVVLGPPGSGKSTLLAHAADEADEATCVVQARGIEAESGLTFATLADLLLPLRDHLTAVPAAQRADLEAALALGPPQPSGPLGVPAGALSLLTAASAHTPVLLVVDDLHLADEPSRRALLFVARRLREPRVALVLALADDQASLVQGYALPTLVLPGLTDAEAGLLLARRGRRLDPGALSDLVRATGGNPAGLLAAAGVPAARGAGDGWARRLRGLPPATLEALLVVVVRGGGSVREAEEALGRAGLSLADLVPAEAGGLLRAAGGRLEPAHPMLTRVLLEEAPIAWRVHADRAGRPGVHARAEPRVPVDPPGRADPSERALDAAVAALLTGDPARARACAVLAAQAQHPAADGVLGAALALGGDVAEGRELLLGALSRRTAVPVRLLPCLARALLWTGDVHDAALALARLLGTSPDGCPPGATAEGYVIRAELSTWGGAWAAARADADEGVRLARAHGLAAVLGPAHLALARLAALRGDRLECARLVGRAQREAGSGEAGPGEAGILGCAALAVGEHAAAAAALSAWADGVRADGVANPVAAPAFADLAEACLLADRRADAERASDWLEAAADRSGLPWARAALSRVRGLLAVDADTAAAHFDEAAEHHRGVDAPFESARTELCRGEVLRRHDRPAAARAPLREALAGFGALGAVTWARRAAEGLARTGAAAADRARPGRAALDLLTPQELQVARAVARGLNNAEAGRSLFVSRKTVEAHLTSVYRKLELRSRTELTRTLLTHDRPQPLDGD